MVIRTAERYLGDLRVSLAPGLKTGEFSSHVGGLGWTLSSVLTEQAYASRSFEQTAQITYYLWPRIYKNSL